jgi:hypothetical protein
VPLKIELRRTTEISHRYASEASSALRLEVSSSSLSSQLVVWISVLIVLSFSLSAKTCKFSSHSAITAPCSADFKLDPTLMAAKSSKLDRPLVENESSLISWHVP